MIGLASDRRDCAVKAHSNCTCNCGKDDPTYRLIAWEANVADDVANSPGRALILLRSESVGGSQALIDDQVVCFRVASCDLVAAKQVENWGRTRFAAQIGAMPFPWFPRLNFRHGSDNLLNAKSFPSFPWLPSYISSYRANQWMDGRRDKPSIHSHIIVDPRP